MFGERDDPVFDSDADIRRIDTRLEFEFINNPCLKVMSSMVQLPLGEQRSPLT